MNILAATDFSTRSNRAVRQAGLLAQGCGAKVTLAHVVDDDQPETLVELEMREAERLLAEQVIAMPELQGVGCTPIVVRGAPFSGILQAATSIQADLIVMGSHRRQILLDIFVGTTIERVVRTGPFAVLMVNNEAQRRYERITAAVDMSEHSANALAIAGKLGLIGETRSTLLHAFLPLAKGKLFVGGASESNINEHVESERQRATDELIAFLAVNELDKQKWSLRVEEGTAMEVISRVVAQAQPDLLILAAHGRSGFVKAFVGSVTEEALRSLNVDILAVPPAKA